MSDQYDDYSEPPANTELSERELEILNLLATGLSNKEIAAQLYLSPNTVKVHLRNIFAKLGVQSRTEATLIAIQRGYVTVPGTAITNEETAGASESSGAGDQAQAGRAKHAGVNAASHHFRLLGRARPHAHDLTGRMSATPTILVIIARVLGKAAHVLACE